MVKVAHLNIRSLNNKSALLSDVILDRHLDIICVSETWLHSNDYLALNLSTPSGFSYFNKPRLTGQGGGLAVIYRDGLPVVEVPTPSVTSFECLVFKIGSAPSVLVVALYRPPKYNPDFFSELAEFLTLLSPICSAILLTGDVNIHVDSPSCHIASRFIEIIDCFNLTQHVNFATHSKGHTLDLVCTSGIIIGDLEGTYMGFSDHKLITFSVHLPHPPSACKRVFNYRNYKAIDMKHFSRSVAELSSFNCVSTYNSELTSLLDKFAPLKERVISFRKPCPWYSPELRLLKVKGRQLERQYKKTGLTVHKQLYDQHLLDYHSACKSARAFYYSQLINDDSGNPRRLFSTINKLLNPRNSPVFSTVDHCNEFLTYFTSKLSHINATICSASPTDPIVINPVCSPLSTFNSFSSVTTSYVLKIISKMSSSTCILDPIPTNLIKECLDVFSPLISNLVNSSLTTGLVPSELKLAAVFPVLKKPGSAAEDLSNYRPVSNLPFLAKVVERVVSAQVQEHVLQSKLLEPFQSGFRAGHSTETALVRVVNDLLVSADAGYINILILLDLTAAFDTVCHSILLDRMETWLGISGTVLSWFQSYLSGRNQFVTLGRNKSHIVQVGQGVPQGSILGPLLFSIYLLPLGHIFRKYGLNFHFYADDAQVYVSCKSDLAPACELLSVCLHEIKIWMQQNFLQLNCSKTEVILIGSPSALLKIRNFNINIDGIRILPTLQVRNLGIIFDSELNFETHIKNICKVSFYYLRNIARLRPFLSPSDAEKLVHAFITCRLDYCNSLYSALPKKSLQKLQYVQNCAARMLTNTSLREHITPVLKKLHWLPVRVRIDFKTLILTFKVVHGTAPVYLCDLVKFYTPSRNLRSVSPWTLQEPICKLKRMGERAFSFRAPRLWNALPEVIKSAPTLDCFKKLLKTHLFSLTFKSC